MFTWASVLHVLFGQSRAGRVVTTNDTWEFAGELIRLPKGAVLPVTLKVLEFEIFTVFPIKVSITFVHFAFANQCVLVFVVNFYLAGVLSPLFPTGT